jgi:hypothetical protein
MVPGHHYLAVTSKGRLTSTLPLLVQEILVQEFLVQEIERERLRQAVAAAAKFTEGFIASASREPCRLL